MEELGRGAQLASQSIMCRMDRKGMASAVPPGSHQRRGLLAPEGCLPRSGLDSVYQ
jgi:hypothetical protein